MVMLLVPAKRDAPTAEAREMGVKLKKLRESQDKTQREVGEVLGISYQTVSAYENGRAILGSDDFRPWSQALGVTVAELTSALGLGIPIGAGDFTKGLAEQFGPDRGQRLEKALRELADLPLSDQDQITESLLDQIAGRHARRSDSN